MRRRTSFVTPRRLTLACRRPAHPPARPARGKERPARRRARGRRPGIFEERGPRLAWTRPRSKRTKRAASSMSRSIERKGAATLDVLAEILPEVIKNFPVAQVDALGRCFSRAQRPALGAPAAFHRRDFRAGDRRPRDRALRNRRHFCRQCHLRPSLHGAAADKSAAVRRLPAGASKGQSRARSGAAARHHPA